VNEGNGLIMQDWRERMDAMKQRRVAAGLPFQIGRDERVAGVGKPPAFDYERDILEHRSSGCRKSQTCAGCQSH